MKRSRPVGRYHLLDRIGSGGMADVYRARVADDDGGERLVALKRVIEMYAEDPTFVKMLVAEYRLSAMLLHPNIARILELLRSPEGYFIVMEYVDGKDLRSTLTRGLELRRPMDLHDAVYLMARAVDGLDHAHAAAAPDGRALRLVHRDFSPSNILVGYDGSVKIIDFGIAKADVDRERTQMGVIKGKVRYMSPEQAQGEDRLTGQSDVFSAGSVLYEMLAGVPAFQAPNEVELIYAVRRAAPRPLRELNPAVPEALEATIQRAMARARKDRFPSAGAFRDELVQFLRATAPNYRRTRLAGYMKAVWAQAIEEELATLLEYALSDAPAAPSVDLLATASVEESMNDLAGVLGPADLAPPARGPRPSFPTPSGQRPVPPLADFPSVPPDDLFAQPSTWEVSTDADPHSSPFGPVPGTPGRGTRR
ncbi:MAG: serine/threonine-protein kinase [Polyangiales bacterium]